MRCKDELYFWTHIFIIRQAMHLTYPLATKRSAQREQILKYSNTITVTRTLRYVSLYNLYVSRNTYCWKDLKLHGCHTYSIKETNTEFLIRRQILSRIAHRAQILKWWQPWRWGPTFLLFLNTSKIWLFNPMLLLCLITQMILDNFSCSKRVYLHS